MSDLQQREAFQAFVMEKRGLWMKLAYRVLGNREESEDVVQETLALLWEKQGLKEVENPGAYVARSVWLNSIKRKTRAKVHLSLDAMAELAAIEGGGEGLEEVDPHRLERALGQLPENQRRVIEMKYYMGLSFKEIGESLQISLNTAGSRCRYALQALREALGHGPEKSGR